MLSTESRHVSHRQPARIWERLFMSLAVVFYFVSASSLAGQMSADSWKLRLQVTLGWSGEERVIDVNSSGSVAVTIKTTQKQHCALLTPLQQSELHEQVRTLLETADTTGREWTGLASDTDELQLEVWWPKQSRHERFRISMISLRDPDGPPEYIADLIDVIRSTDNNARTKCSD